MASSHPVRFKVLEIAAILCSLVFCPVYMLCGQTEATPVFTPAASTQLLSLLKEGQYLLLLDAPGGYCFSLQPGETPLRIHSVSDQVVTIDSFKKTTSWNNELQGTIHVTHVERISIPTKSIVKLITPAVLIPKQ